MVVLPVLSFSKTGHLLHVNVAKELRKHDSSIFSQTASNSTKDNRVKIIKVWGNDTSELLLWSAIN